MTGTQNRRMESIMGESAVFQISGISVRECVCRLYTNYTEQGSECRRLRTDRLALGKDESMSCIGVLGPIVAFSCASDLGNMLMVSGLIESHMMLS